MTGTRFNTMLGFQQLTRSRRNLIQNYAKSIISFFIIVLITDTTLIQL